MSSPAAADGTVPLGDIAPNGSRQLGRRSAVCWAGDAVVAGLDDGTVVAFEAGTLEERWRHEGGDGSVVSLAPFAGSVLAGERGADGAVRLHDGDTGAVRWRYHTADDVGEPQKDSRFFLPFVADAVTSDGAAYVAALRYERGPDGERSFQSVVYAFAPDGRVRWRHGTDASPVSLSVRGDRVAVAFNRCPGDDRDGVQVLDPADGGVRWRWDPPGDGQRRVGDVSLVEDGLAVASHADYRVYLLGGDGVRWAIDLGRPVERGDETVYSYPNHVHATGDGAVFVTGNTFPEEGRETDVRHPREHTVVGVSPGGEVRWETATGGFAHGIATEGDRVAVPVAQHFRDRDPSVHGVVEVEASTGLVHRETTAGVATAAALGPSLAVVEEAVEYHDEGEHRGAYRLHVPGR